MIGVTLLGLFLTPVFYVVLMKLGVKRTPPKPPVAEAGDGSAPQAVTEPASV
jgi:hypothetical protein